MRIHRAFRVWRSRISVYMPGCMVCYFFTLNRDVQSVMDVVLICFCFMIFVIRLSRARMISADLYAYFCCSDVAFCGTFLVFRGDFSYVACVHRICNISNFLYEDILIYWWTWSAGSVFLNFLFYTSISFCNMFIFTFYVV